MGDRLLSAFLSHRGLSEESAELIGQRFYSDVYRISSGGKTRVAKMSTPHRVLCPQGFRTKSAAADFGTDVMDYMEKLEALGIPISPVSETTFSVLGVEETGESFVVLDVPYAGESVETLLVQAQSEAVFYDLAQKMVRGILPIFQQRPLPGGYREVGIDPVPSNFAMMEAEVMVYIDYTPPRHSSPRCEYRIEYPQPTAESELRAGRWTYYDPCGITIRWLTDSCRIRPDARQVFLDVLCESLPAKIWNTMRERLPSLRLQYYQWRPIIESTYGSIDLRDMACGLAAADGTDPIGTRRWLQKFFEDSRHHPGRPFPEGMLDVLRSQLLDRLSAI